MAAITKWLIGRMTATAKGADIVDDAFGSISISDSTIAPENDGAIRQNIKMDFLNCCGPFFFTFIHKITEST